MAKELQCDAPTASTVRAQVRNRANGQVWYTVTPAFEAYSTAHVASYAVTMTEAGTASGYFTGDFPSAIPAGLYDVIYFILTGGSLAEGDTKVSIEQIQWSGTAPLSLNVIPLVTTTTTVTNQLTAAQIATGVWQDATSGDFTVASSIGKALYIANVAPGGSGGHLISGSNSGTTTLGALTVSGATTLAAVSMTTLTASGAVAFQSTFAVTTSTSLAALSATTVTFSGAVAFQSTFAVTTSTSLAALSCTTLTASGAVAFQSTFATTGTTTFNAFTVTNAFTVSGATTFTGAITGSNASNDLRINGVAPGASGGLFIAGTNAATTVNFTGSLSGSVGSVSGNVVGSVGSISGITFPTNFSVLSITASTGRVDVALIEGSDATNQIRDSVVDDSTRIDASALNTLSGHDPGETIMGATDTVVLADASLTTAKLGTFVLAKTTNITGFTDLDAAGVRSAVGLASANLDAQIGTLATSAALTTATLGIAPISTGTLQDGGVASATLASGDSGEYQNYLLRITSGQAATQTRVIYSYNSETKIASISPSWSFSPSAGDTYAIIPLGPVVVAAANGQRLTGVGGPNFANFWNTYSNPWAVPVPGAFSSGTAGFILGTYVTAAAPTAAENAAAVAAQIITDHGSGSYLTATSVTVSDKTGFSLAAAGLDLITATRPSGVSSIFPQMIVSLFYREYGKTVYDSNANTLKTYAANGTTVVTTQTATSSGGIDTQGEAS